MEKNENDDKSNEMSPQEESSAGKSEEPKDTKNPEDKEEIDSIAPQNDEEIKEGKNTRIPEDKSKEIIEQMLSERKEKQEKAVEERKKRIEDAGKNQKKQDNIPEKVRLESWRREFGHDAENKLEDILRNTPEVVIVGWEGHKNYVRMPGKVYVARSDAMADFDEGVDFAIAWGQGAWMLFDLTVATDPEILDTKYKKEKLGGPGVVEINYHTIDEAYKGGEIFKKKVYSEIRNTVLRMKENSLQRNPDRL